MLALPHTSGCLVCGRNNPRSLRLSLFADDAGIIHSKYTPHVEHVGFTGIVHGGMLATVLDETMVWAASWHAKRFHLCAEMNIRFRHPISLGHEIAIRAKVERAAARLVLTSGEILDATGKVLCESSGKYMPLDDMMNQKMLATIQIEDSTRDAARQLLSLA